MDYCPGQHRAQGRDAGRLLLDHDRPLRHVGHRVRLQAALGRHRGRSGRAEEDRRPRRPSRRWPTPPTRTPAASIPTRWPIASTWARTRSPMPRCGRKLIAELWPKVIERDDQGRRRLPAGCARRSACCWAITAGRCTSRRGYVGGVYVNRDAQGRPERHGAVRRGRAGPSSARHWPCSKSRCSATSRSSSRPSCTTTWPRRAGITGARRFRCAPTMRYTK